MVTVCSSIQSLGVSLRPAAGPGPRRRLGEVHHLHGVLVHRHRPRHRLRAAVLRPARDVGLGTLCKQTQFSENVSNIILLECLHCVSPSPLSDSFSTRW